MKLKNVEVLPGVVINNKDPYKIGRIKATCPSLFDTRVMEEAGLPWIYPVTFGTSQQFSILPKGAKVWILNNTENYGEFWYIPMVEFNMNTQMMKADNSNADVLISRDLGPNSVGMYYNDSEGMSMNVGESSKINISNDDNIQMKATNAEINMNSTGVYMGVTPDGKQPFSTEPAVLGQSLCDVLSAAGMKLAEAGSACQGNVATQIGRYLMDAGNLLMQASASILSSSVFINEGTQEKK